MTLSRRDLLTRAAAGVGLVAVGDLTALLGAAPALASGHGYGPLRPDPAGLLDLPAGFRYSILDQEGEPLVGHAGVVPGRYDGTAAFRGPGGGVRLVRNHEQGGSATYAAAADPSLTYDPAATGGNTTVHLDGRDRVTSSYVSLGGTFNNCAGGATPWGTWLTCEETEQRANATFTKDHGFVFEVDPTSPSNNDTPTALTGLGRYAHEAVVVDPETGTLYLTEDASGPFGLVYRFVPNDATPEYGALRAGGTLTAVAASIGGVHVPNLHGFSVPGTTLDVTWVPVPDPLAAATSTRKQLADTQVTRSRKFEGAWWGDGKAYIVCSFAEGVHHGQVWSYDPAAQTLTLVVYLALKDVDDPGEGPDNITISPWGGLLLAEDGDGQQFLLAVDEAGATHPFARNARDESEFTGPVFSPDRQTLYANIQDPGITFAITGPFARL